MPRLILLNGPPSAGKSTLARRYVEHHPMSLNLDIDVVRSLIGGWRADQGAAGLAARAMALAAARVHLSAGFDVVVPQLVAVPEFIESLASLAAEVGAAFNEIVLRVERSELSRRYAERISDESHASIRQPLDEAELVEFQDRLERLASSRPRAIAIVSKDGQIEQAYADLLACIARA